jgi:hypothetical protein
MKKMLRKAWSVDQSIELCLTAHLVKASSCLGHNACIYLQKLQKHSLCCVSKHPAPSPDLQPSSSQGAGLAHAWFGLHEHRRPAQQQRLIDAL